VVAISQQHLYLDPSFSELTENEVSNWATRVVAAWKDKFRPMLQRSCSWEQWVKRGITLDVGCTNGEPYFIEPNPHGAQYAAGSALFHWKRDHAVLHGERLPRIEVRWIKQ
jgi:hypothetical protein